MFKGELKAGRRVYIPESGLGGGYWMEESECRCGLPCQRFEDGSGGFCELCREDALANKKLSSVDPQFARELGIFP